MHKPNRWRTLRLTKEDGSAENEGRRPRNGIPKVIYAPELPKDPYPSPNKPPFVPALMRDYDDYDHC